MEAELTMKHVRPFWGRVTVLESLVDEATRDSGLIVPLVHDSDDGVKRGVVADVDDDWDDPGRKRACERLPPGTAVYYRGGIRIGDVIILEIGEILAVEEE